MCEHKRVISISAKCSDMFSMQYAGHEMSGYVPSGIVIGDGQCGDYVAFSYCADCGQIQTGKFPISEKNILKALKDMR